jgi:hypothetical protein
MSATHFESFLAKLYVDERARSKFLADPHAEAIKAGLTAAEIEAVAKIDRVGLDLLTKSLERKRRRKFPNAVG